MPAIHVNPTRMELTRLKKRLRTAKRGHKLLKDKRDEMMRRFVIDVRRNKAFREEVERELTAALQHFVLARAMMDQASLETAVLCPSRSLELSVSKRNIMSVNVPVFKLIENTSVASAYPYGFLETSGELDAAIAALDKVLFRMVELAEVEKACNMLADEIEKTRRRVNALEYVMIPDMVITIRAITMKLEENERGNLTRLMKVKSMLAARAEQASAKPSEP